MNNNIPLHNDIFNAIQNNQLVLFLGAGVSKSLGLPDWKELTSKLLQSSIDDEVSTFLENELIQSYLQNDYKKIISVIFEKYKLMNKIDFFNLNLSRYLTITEFDKTNPIYKFIELTNPLVLTTNIDNVFDKQFMKDNIFYKDNYMEWPRRGPSIVHIHGKISEPDTIVFTASQYVEKYFDLDFKYYLESIFTSEKTILFLGYSFSEFELLEKILRTIDKKATSKIFTLNAYYSFQQTLKDNMSNYYKSLRIEQLDYCLDNFGYKNFNNQIADWVQYLKNHSIDLTNQKKIREYLKDYNKENLHLLKQIIKDNEEYKFYAFKKIEQLVNPTKWLLEFSNNYWTPISRAIGLDQSKTNATWFYILTLHRVYLTTKNKEIKKSLINKILSLSNNKKIYKTRINSNFIVNIVLIVMSFKELVSNEVVNKLIIYFIDTQQVEDEFIIYHLNSKDYVKRTTKELYPFELKIIKNSIVSNLDSSINNSNIELITYIKKNDITTLSGFEICKLCINKINESNDNIFYKFNEFGSINRVLKNNYSLDGLYLLHIFFYFYENLLTKDKKILLEIIIKSRKKISKNILLYLILIDYNENKKLLLTKNFNPFYNRSYFSELYILLKEKLNDLEPTFIESLKFQIDYYFKTEKNYDAHLLYMIDSVSKLLGLKSNDHFIDKKYFNQFENYDKPEEFSVTIKSYSYSSNDLVSFYHSNFSNIYDLKTLNNNLYKIEIIFPFTLEDHKHAFELYLNKRIHEFKIDFSEYENFNVDFKENLFWCIANNLERIEKSPVKIILNYFLTNIEIFNIKNLTRLINVLSEKEIDFYFNKEFIDIKQKLITLIDKDNLKVEFSNIDTYIQKIENNFTYSLFSLILKKEKDISILEKCFKINDFYFSFLLINNYILYELNPGWFIKMFESFIKNASTKEKNKLVSLLFLKRCTDKIYELIISEKFFIDFVNSNIDKETFYLSHLKRISIQYILHNLILKNYKSDSVLLLILNRNNTVNIVDAFDVLRYLQELYSNNKNYLKITNNIINFYLCELETVEISKSNANHVYIYFIDVINKLNVININTLNSLENLIRFYSGSYTNEFYKLLLRVVKKYPEKVINIMKITANNTESYKHDENNIVKILKILIKMKIENAHQLISEYQAIGFDLEDINF